MYPLALILGIGTFQNDFSVKRFVLPMAAIGWFISLFHYLEQKVPGFAAIKPCVNGVPCTTQYIVTNGDKIPNNNGLNFPKNNG